MDAVEFFHREAFAAPADEEPEAAGEYEKLEKAVEDGDLGSVLVFPAWVQVISTLPYPPAVQCEINIIPSTVAKRPVCQFLDR
mgnify:CR=1 FL=1